MKHGLRTAETERRSLVRQKVGISADVIDLRSNENHYCHVIDATREGCRIYCDSIHELPDFIFLHPDGVSKPIRASILWRNGMTAGL